MAGDAKTRPTSMDVAAFIAAVPDARRREDAEAACALLAEVSGEPPVMWGPSIVGFGACRYRYESGREGDAPLVGFSPRKANLVFYLSCGDAIRGDMLARLGKHKAGVGCIYVNRLSDIDPAVLRELAVASITGLKARYPG